MIILIRQIESRQSSEPIAQLATFRMGRTRSRPALSASSRTPIYTSLSIYIYIYIIV